jgi:nucleoside-diphosphate-sugar epimerase
MKIFIAGATGVLGRRVVQKLMAKGHQIVGLSRSAQNREWLNQHGAIPREGDLFDLEQLADITADCEAILHLATAIPTKSRSTRQDWALNDRIRREGTENLVAAALRHNCKLYLQESVTLIYGHRNGEWVDETASLPEQQLSMLQSAVDMERIVREAARQKGLPATILRFGTFYSYDSAHTQSMFQLIKKRFFPIIGSGKGYWNIINVDDAAKAIAKTIEHYDRCLNQTFNVCDDEPVQSQSLIDFMAETLGAGKPRHIPVWLAKGLLGSSGVDVLLTSVRCKNQLIKEKTGWEPEYPTYRQGVIAEVEKWLARSG